MKTNSQIAHHAVANDGYTLEFVEDLADLVGSVPSHITAAGRERSVDANPAAVGHGRQQTVLVGAEGRERVVQVERGEGAIRRLSEVGKDVCDIRRTIWSGNDSAGLEGILEGWLEGIRCVGNKTEGAVKNGRGFFPDVL